MLHTSIAAMESSAIERETSEYFINSPAQAYLDGSYLSIKRSVYKPTTSYGLGRLVAISEGIPLELKPIKAQSFNPDSMNLWLRQLIQDSLDQNLETIESISAETDIPVKQIRSFLLGSDISFDSGYDIECYLLETINP